MERSKECCGILKGPQHEVKKEGRRRSLAVEPIGKKQIVPWLKAQTNLALRSSVVSVLVILVPVECVSEGCGWALGYDKW